MYPFSALICISVAFVVSLSRCCSADSSNGPAAARYSYSLTTFDPSGKLGQVERAGIAASQGVPILGVSLINGDQSRTVLMAAPQILQSPLVIQDGTPRFVKITSEILIGHSGITADGRILMDAAKKIAIQYQYTFDEPISIEVFLEEIALVLQESTMEPGVRPFGATLVVAYVPSAERQLTTGHKVPCFYRIDPSGLVQLLGNSAFVVNGNFKIDQIQSELDKIHTSGATTTEAGTALRNLFVGYLKEKLPRKADSDDSSLSNISVLLAALELNGGFEISNTSIE